MVQRTATTSSDILSPVFVLPVLGCTNFLFVLLDYTRNLDFKVSYKGVHVKRLSSHQKIIYCPNFKWGTTSVGFNHQPVVHLSRPPSLGRFFISVLPLLCNTHTTHHKQQTLFPKSRGRLYLFLDVVNSYRRFLTSAMRHGKKRTHGLSVIESYVVELNLPLTSLRS